VNVGLKKINDEIATFKDLVSRSGIVSGLAKFESVLRKIHQGSDLTADEIDYLSGVTGELGASVHDTTKNLELHIRAMREFIPFANKAAEYIRERFFPKPKEADEKAIQNLKALINDIDVQAQTQNLNDVETALFDLNFAYKKAFGDGSNLTEKAQAEAKGLREEIDRVTEALKKAKRESLQLGLVGSGFSGARREAEVEKFKRDADLAAARKSGLKGVDLENELKSIRAEYDPLITDLLAYAEIEDFMDSLSGVRQTIVSGFVDAFTRGEKLSKAWATITADIWRQQMTKSLDRIASTIQTKIGNVFAKLFGAESGAGVAGALAGMAGALLTVVGGILANLNSKTQTQIDDFEDSVTDSEAVRGVVAGPTNVAIAKVGDSLKTALQTTEQLLLRIAISLEEGPGTVSPGGGVRRPVNPGLTYNLSGSSIG
jgi:hypothetical protein